MAEKKISNSEDVVEKTDARKNSAKAEKCRRKFLRFFPKGFYDDKYVDWERGFKWTAHEKWREQLDQKTFQALLKDENFTEIAARAVRLESKTNLLFSFEKMALRDAVKTPEGARLFAEGLYDFIYGAYSQRNTKYARSKIKLLRATLSF